MKKVPKFIPFYWQKPMAKINYFHWVSALNVSKYISSVMGWYCPLIRVEGRLSQRN